MSAIDCFNFVGFFYPETRCSAQHIILLQCWPSKRWPNIEARLVQCLLSLSVLYLFLFVGFTPKLCSPQMKEAVALPLKQGE